ncbi:MAG TPA: HAD family hydrolase, partial [Clostridia bacterium]|nr:HAD family hydrolase [Clostridia bacterium]
MQTKWLLASDIDNTLTGDRPALDALRAEIEELRAANKLFLILSTGRRLSQVIDGFEQEGIPVPDAIVSQVGTEIYLPPYHRGDDPLHAWRDML